MKKDVLYTFDTRERSNTHNGKGKCTVTKEGDHKAMHKVNGMIALLS
jgi:hypothetical protein